MPAARSNGGHEVFTPSLTGIGERAHPTSPQVCLTTHIAGVVNAVWYEDLSDIVLLGFSYGGFVVTGARGHIAGRVRHLVYLDAFVPGDGDTVAGLGGTGTSHGATGPDPLGPLGALGRDWLVPPLPREFDDPAETAWAAARRTRLAASPNRSGWRARWRTTRSPAPTSRRPGAKAPGGRAVLGRR